MQGFSCKVMLGSLLVLLLAGFCVQSLPKALGSLEVEDGRIVVDVYVVALEGVEAVEVGNVSRVWDGARDAVRMLNERNFTVRLPFLRYWRNVSSHFSGVDGGVGPFGDMKYIHVRFPANASCRLVTEWEEYKSVVESSRECIVVNVHGAVIPVPQGYSREAWVDKIAEAMLYRNLTWVHVGGYPFYYIQRQSSTMETWGDNGLKQLMKNIGKPNVTCHPQNWGGTHDGMNERAIVIDDMWLLEQAYIARRVWPLNTSDFKDLVAMPIWGYYSRSRSCLLTGAAIAFRKSLNDTGFGFYVHIGTNETYSQGGRKENADYFRGHVGCATGLWCLVCRTARETILSEAQASIDRAVGEGRTQGLDEAYTHLDEAWRYDTEFYGDSWGFWAEVYDCMAAALDAEEPSPSLDMEAAVMIVAVIGIVSFGAGMIWRKKNHRD